MELIGQLSNSAHQDKLANLTRQIGDDTTGASQPRTARQHQRRLSAEEVETLVAAYESGTSIKDLTTAYGLHRKTVVRHLDRALVIRRATPLAQINVEKLAQLYAQGWSLKQIGDRFGVRPTSVYYRLRQAGVTMRPRNGWKRD